MMSNASPISAQPDIPSGPHQYWGNVGRLQPPRYDMDYAHMDPYARRAHGNNRAKCDE
jgi:hypothetical protein